MSHQHYFTPVELCENQRMPQSAPNQAQGSDLTIDSFDLEVLPEDRFCDEECVGSGSYGTVYKTWDQLRQIVSGIRLSLTSLLHIVCRRQGQYGTEE